MDASPSTVSAHVIVAGGLDDPVIELTAEDAHHLASVLRLRSGELVGATDGKGGYVPCRFAGGGAPGRLVGPAGGRPVLEPVGPLESRPRPAPPLTVGFALVKGDRPEWAVQKLTELGIDRIVVLDTDRGVVRWSGSRAASHLDRLAKVARAAVMQSRQVWLPEIVGPVSLGSFLESSPGSSPGSDPGSPPGSSAGSSPGSSPGSENASVGLAQPGGPPAPAGIGTILIGPEGGWSPEELEVAPVLVGLADSVLRTETAAVTAGVLLSALRAGRVSDASAASQRHSPTEGGGF